MPRVKALASPPRRAPARAIAQRGNLPARMWAVRPAELRVPVPAAGIRRAAPVTPPAPEWALRQRETSAVPERNRNLSTAQRAGPAGRELQAQFRAWAPV